MMEGFRLPCGHHFHIFCLCDWVETQWTCPVCRLSIDEKSIERMRNGMHSPFSRRGNSSYDPISEFCVCSNCTHYECDAIKKMRKIRSSYLGESSGMIRKVYKIRKLFPQIPLVSIIGRFEGKKRLRELTSHRITEALTRENERKFHKNGAEKLLPGYDNEGDDDDECGGNVDAFIDDDNDSDSDSDDGKDERVPTLRDDFGRSSAERSISLTKRKKELFNFAKKKMQMKKKDMDLKKR